MATHHSTIEINGKHYDARTGKLLDKDAPKAQKQADAKPVRVVHDGMVKNPAPAKRVHKHLERSQTLMRHAVKKPAKLATPKPSAASVATDIKSPVLPLSVPSVLFNAKDSEREKRASRFKQSNLVSKFGSGAVHTDTQPVIKKVQPLAVQPAPALSQLATHTQAAEKLIEKGLRAAQSHNNSHHFKPARSKRAKRTKLASIASASMAVLLLGAFFAFQNVPNVSMRYAAAKAGVSAHLPSYKPAGFSLSNRIQYNPGQVTVNFSSNSDERSFSITQRSSTWNSETLLNNHVASASDQFQTFEDKGRTIYLYGSSHATWVNGGVWYEIDGNSQLNSDQLIRIASSM